MIHRHLNWLGLQCIAKIQTVTNHYIQVKQLWSESLNLADKILIRHYCQNIKNIIKLVHTLLYYSIRFLFCFQIFIKIQDRIQNEKGILSFWKRFLLCYYQQLVIYYCFSNCSVSYFTKCAIIFQNCIKYSFEATFCLLNC